MHKNSIIKLYLKLRYFVFLVVLVIYLPFKNFAQNPRAVKRPTENTQKLEINNSDSIANSDSLQLPNDSGKENLIESKIIYSADDSINLDRKTKKVYLYNNAKIEYGDVTLEAYYIEYDQEKNYVYAEGIKDSLGILQGKPEFKEKGDEFVAKTIKYNFKTKKGYIEDVFTEEEQGFLHSEQTMKLEDNSLLLKSGKYTTCENEEHPHFYLSLTKAKVVPGDKIISGPAYLVMEDIPFPIGVPFGFFPSQQQFSSGVIIPSYGEESNRGFYLRDGGYYFGISDKMDLAVTGDIYSKGSWASDAKFRFKKRYKFNSNFNFSYAVFTKGEEDEKQKNMKIQWTHTQDAKANPNSNFSASVNYTTTDYDNYNSKNIDQRAQNTKQSSISYGKTWAGKPYRLNVDLRHSQNSNNKSVNMTLPVMTFNIDRQYPFRRKNASGESKWYEDIEIQYSSKMENKINTYDSLLFTDTKWSDFENGFQHNIPLSTNIKILKYFNLSPQVKYTGILYPEKTDYSYADSLNADGETVYFVDSKTNNGLSYAQMVEPSVSFSASPNIYGMYQFKNPNSKIIAVRHVMTPSVGISYRPDLGSMVEGYYFSDSISGKDLSIYQGGIYNLPAAPGESGGISFGLGNNLEMKVRNDKDTSETTKKIKILESLRFSTNYNIFAEEFKWSPISIKGRTSLFNQKLSLNFGGSLNTYAIDSTGTRINRSHWFQNQDKSFINRLGRLERFDFSMSFKLNSKKGDEKSHNEEQEFNASQSYNDIYGYQEQVMTYVDFDIPWDLNVNYKYVYSKRGLESTKKITQTIGLNGNFSLTKKWKITFRANYDIEEMELTTSSIEIVRDLHCWEMRFTWIPVGYMQSYNFVINVKGSTLRDFLKYDKRKTWQDNL